MSGWRKEWRDSALCDDIGNAIYKWLERAAPYANPELDKKYWEPIFKQIEKVMETVEAEAIAAEREACAKIAEEVARGLVISTDHDRGLSQASTFIADAIRARGQTTSD